MRRHQHVILRATIATHHRKAALGTLQRLVKLAELSAQSAHVGDRHSSAGFVVRRLVEREHTFIQLQGGIKSSMIGIELGELRSTPTKSSDSVRPAFERAQCIVCTFQQLCHCVCPTDTHGPIETTFGHIVHVRCHHKLVWRTSTTLALVPQLWHFVPTSNLRESRNLRPQQAYSSRQHEASCSVSLLFAHLEISRESLFSTRFLHAWMHSSSWQIDRQ
jgi:hypothetical protein